MALTEEGMSKDGTKGENSIITEDIWDMRSWIEHDKGDLEALQLIREIMLRWWKRNLLRYFVGNLVRDLQYGGVLVQAEG